MEQCDLCHSVMRNDNIKKHRGGRFCRIRCDICAKSVHSSDIKEHRDTHLSDLNISLQSDSLLSQSLEDTTGTPEDSNIVDIIAEHQAIIGDYEKHGLLLSQYNYEIHRLSHHEIIHHFKKVFKVQKNAFKINVSIGLILYNRQTEEYALYRSSRNNQLLLEKPKLIRNNTDKDAFVELVRNLDLIDRLSRPSSSWTFAAATNLTYYVYKLDGVLIGAPITLPDFLSNNKGLYSLMKNRRGEDFADKKCLFRCLALHQGASINKLETKTKSLLNEYVTKFGIQNFDGVTIDQLQDISQLFDVGIRVYEQTTDKKTNLLFRSTLDNNLMYLNLYQDHFSYIFNIQKYSRAYRCEKCDKIWNHHGSYVRHIKVCEKGIRKIYKGGTFTLKPTIFEELEILGIDIPQSERFFPYR